MMVEISKKEATKSTCVGSKESFKYKQLGH